MINELIFIFHAMLVMVATLTAKRIGQQALVVLIALFAVIANLFVLKQITLFGLNATASDVYIVGASLSLNLLQEYYGRSEVRRAIWISFFAAIVYTIMSQIHILYAPSLFDVSSEHFRFILRPMPRLIIASLFSYLVAEFTNYKMFSLLKNHLIIIPFSIRSLLATGISQLVDTLLFSFLGLYGIISSLWSVIIISYSIKLLAIFLSAPFLFLAKIIFSI